MATAVFFHAHPDDESLFTGGTIARAAAEGHRAVVVTATGGEEGHDYSGELLPGESLTDRRAAELKEATRILGAECQQLGYLDSGADHESPAAGGFATLDPRQPAERLAGLLTDVGADILVTYDERGGYGHPDHIQTHRVGVEAAAEAGVAAVMVTFDRHRIQSLVDAAAGFGIEVDDRLRTFADALGVAPELITTTVDVSDYVEQKRRAMAAHLSQLPPSSFIQSLPAAAFTMLFGTEWYIDGRGRRAAGNGAGSGADWLFP
jgi:LmbE family N-acetylglucosaminyl deacetylase